MEITVHIQNKTASGIKKRIQPQSQNKKDWLLTKRPSLFLLEDTQRKWKASRSTFRQMPKGCAWPLDVKAAPCLIPFTHASKYFSTHIFQEFGPFLFPYHDELLKLGRWTELNWRGFRSLVHCFTVWSQVFNPVGQKAHDWALLQSLLLLLPGLLQFFSAIQFWNVWQFLSGRLWKDPVRLWDLQKTLQNKVQSKAAMVINSRLQFI